MMHEGKTLVVIVLVQKVDESRQSERQPNMQEDGQAYRQTYNYTSGQTGKLTENTMREGNI